jgi:hypothetical protein
MSEPVTSKDRWAAGDAARFDAQFGMHVLPDDRPSSPERLAYEAFERGDLLFQIDMPVSYTQGTKQATTTAASRTVHGPAVDLLGAIEKQGWRLEHVAASYISQGTVGSGDFQAAHHGALVGIYVFRRDESRRTS